MRMTIYLHNTKHISAVHAIRSPKIDVNERKRKQIMKVHCAYHFGGATTQEKAREKAFPWMMNPKAKAKAQVLTLNL